MGGFDGCAIRQVGSEGGNGASSHYAMRFAEIVCLQRDGEGEAVGQIERDPRTAGVWTLWGTSWSCQGQPLYNGTGVIGSPASTGSPASWSRPRAPSYDTQRPQTESGVIGRGRERMTVILPFITSFLWVWFRRCSLAALWSKIYFAAQPLAALV